MRRGCRFANPGSLPLPRPHSSWPAVPRSRLSGGARHAGAAGRHAADAGQVKQATDDLISERDHLSTGALPSAGSRAEQCRASAKRCHKAPLQTTAATRPAQKACAKAPAQRKSAPAAAPEAAVTLVPTPSRDKSGGIVTPTFRYTHGRILSHPPAAALRVRGGQPRQGGRPQRRRRHRRSRHGQSRSAGARARGREDQGDDRQDRAPTAIRRPRGFPGCAARRPLITRAASA